jgi:hypothetical protein
MCARAVFVSAVVASILCGGASARPDVPGSDLFTFDVDDEIFTYDTVHFRVHYSKEGVHRVPSRDNDASGVPDHVESLGSVYEAALAAYLDLGFRAPLSDDNLPQNGGDGRFDVYLVDFARAADGAFRAEVCDGDVCAGYMVQENDFAGYGYPSVAVGNRTVGSHELFHAVQAAYDANQGAVLSEGTAVWASERFDPSLFDLEGFSSGYLDEAERPLDAPATGPVDPFGYGASLFFQFLDEQLGPQVLVRLWESVVDGADGALDPEWFDTIDGVLREASAEHGFADVFADFCVATLFTDARADPSQGFLRGDDYALRPAEDDSLPVVSPRFVVFTASSRLVQVHPGNRSRIVLRVVGEGTAVDGVRAFLLPVYADQTAGTLVPIDDPVRGGAVELTNALTNEDNDVESVLALLVNTRSSGQGARPRVCIGDDQEVAACANEVAAGEDDDAAADTGSDDGAGDEHPGQGCTSSPASFDPLVSVVAALLALRRRRGSRFPR